MSCKPLTLGITITSIVQSQKEAITKESMASFNVNFEPVVAKT